MSMLLRFCLMLGIALSSFSIQAAVSVNSPLQTYKSTNMETSFLQCHYQGVEFVCSFLVENISSSNINLSTQARQSYFTTTDGRRVLASRIDIADEYSTTTRTLRTTLYSQYTVQVRINFGEIASSFQIDSLYFHPAQHTFGGLSGIDLNNSEYFPLCRTDDTHKSFIEQGNEIKLNACGRENGEVVCDITVINHNADFSRFSIDGSDSYLELEGGRRIMGSNITLGNHDTSRSITHTYPPNIPVHGKIHFGSVSSAFTQFTKMGIDATTTAPVIFKGITLRSDANSTPNCERDIFKRTLVEFDLQSTLDYCYLGDAQRLHCQISLLNQSLTHQTLTLVSANTQLIDGSGNRQALDSNLDLELPSQTPKALALTFDTTRLNLQSGVTELQIATVEYGVLNFENINYLISHLQPTQQLVSQPFQLDELVCGREFGDFVCHFRVQNISLSRQQFRVDASDSYLYDINGTRYVGKFAELVDNYRTSTISHHFNALESHRVSINFGDIGLDKQHFNGLILDTNLSLLAKFDNIAVSKTDQPTYPIHTIQQEDYAVEFKGCDQSSGVLSCRLTLQNLRSVATRVALDVNDSTLYDADGFYYEATFGTNGADSGRTVAYHTVPVGGSVDLTLNFGSVSGLDRFQGLVLNLRTNSPMVFRCINMPIDQCHFPQTTPIEPPATCTDCLVIYDHLEPPTSTTGTLWMKSKEGSLSMASYFKLEEPATINRLTWIGYLLDNSSLALNDPEFAVRIYRGLQLPDDYSYQQIDSHAKARSLFSLQDAGRGVYEFVIEQDDLFILSPGEYWISIHEPVDQNYRFGIEVHPDAYSPTAPTGAYQATPLSPWQPFDYKANLRVEGKKDEEGFTGRPWEWDDFPGIFQLLQ